MQVLQRGVPRGRALGVDALDDVAPGTGGVGDLAAELGAAGEAFPAEVASLGLEEIGQLEVLNCITPLYPVGPSQGRKPWPARSGRPATATSIGRRRPRI